MEMIAAMKEPMNRINRLLWEEANVRELEKLKSRGSVSAKVLWVAFLVGLFVLLTERPWRPSFYEARVQTASAKKRKPSAPMWLRSPRAMAGPALRLASQA